MTGRRTVRPELEFGSDSFLDVICNIVGILIILIVVVAVKVERQPKGGDARPVEQASVTAGTRTPDLGPRIAELELTRSRLTGEHDQQSSAVRQLTLDDEQAAARIHQLMSDREEAQRSRQSATRAIEELTDQQQTLARSRSELEVQTAALKKQIDERDQEALSIGDTLVTVTRAEDSARAGLRNALVETQRLQEVLTQTHQAAAPRDRLQHRLSPVSRTVSAEEVFFRVEHGRISHVPILELMERLKAQVKSKSAAILRFSQFEGAVGPVNGYRLSYIVEKSGETTLDELIWGDGRVSISVRQWTVIPDSSLVEETVEEALLPESQFRQLLGTVEPGQTITIWVYPDSFAAFASLREIAHGLNLRVAGRPMPSGTPIVGSPNGSRSAAQ